jgi:hypothetical protein
MKIMMLIIIIIILVVVVVIFGTLFNQNKQINMNSTDNQSQTGQSTNQRSGNSKPPVDSVQNPPPLQFDNLEAKIGVKAVGWSGVTILPLQIVEDSRCPEDVLCMQTGRIVVQTQISFRGSDPEVYNLERNKEVKTRYGNLTLTEAKPNRKAKVELKPADYTFKFHIQS